LALKQEIKDILFDFSIELHTLNRLHFNKVLEKLFIQKGWETQPKVFNETKKELGSDFTNSHFYSIFILKF